MGRIYTYEVHDDDAIVRVKGCSLDTINYDSESDEFYWLDRSNHKHRAFSDEIAAITTDDHSPITYLYYEYYKVKRVKPPQAVLDILKVYKIVP